VTRDTPTRCTPTCKPCRPSPGEPAAPAALSVQLQVALAAWRALYAGGIPPERVSP
jgi:hypothetical protein